MKIQAILQAIVKLTDVAKVSLFVTFIGVIFAGMAVPWDEFFPVDRSVKIQKNTTVKESIIKPNKKQLKEAILEELKRLAKGRTLAPFDIDKLVGIKKINKITPMAPLKYHQKNKYFSVSVLINATAYFDALDMTSSRIIKEEDEFEKKYSLS